MGFWRLKGFRSQAALGWLRDGGRIQFIRHRVGA